MSALNKKLRKRRLDGERLRFVVDELPLLRKVMRQGKGVFMENEGRNLCARTALQSLGIIGLALHELSSDIKKAHADLDWDGFRRLRNYIAHDYMSWDLDLLWETLAHRTPMLEATVPKLVKWDADHPVAPKKEPIADVHRSNEAGGGNKDP